MAISHCTDDDDDDDDLDAPLIAQKYYKQSDY
jgi:hypothetical protein